MRRDTYNAVGGNSLELELGLADGEVLAEQVVGGLSEVSEGDGDVLGHCYMRVSKKFCEGNHVSKEVHRDGAKRHNRREGVMPHDLFREPRPLSFFFCLFLCS